jgi:hypothetical protein
LNYAPPNSSRKAKTLRFLAKLILAFAIVVAVVTAVLTSYAMVVKARAESLLKGVTALSVGTSTGTEARQFAERHKGYLWQVSAECNDDNCSRTFSIRNRWLSALRLEPEAQFQADVTVKNGTVDSIGAYLFREMPIFPTFNASAGMVNEHSYIPGATEFPEHYYFKTPVGKPYLRVVLDSQASASQRQHAFDFSFRCLVKPGGGCDLPCDYLPSAWKDWKESLRNTPLWPEVFNERYPNNSRCGP